MREWHAYEGEVGGCYDAHAPVHGFLVVFGIFHLAHDGQESGCAGATAENGRCCCYPRRECRVSDDVVAEFEGTFLWRGGRTVDSGDSDTGVFFTSTTTLFSFTSIHKTSVTYTTTKTAMKTEANPAHVIHAIFSNFLALAATVIIMAAMTEK